MYKGTESWTYMARLRIRERFTMSGGQVHKVCRDKTGKRNWSHVVCEVKEFVIL